MLASQRRDTRSFEIVGATMANDQLPLVVDISDRGIAWGRQTLRATIQDGFIQRLEPIAFRFLF